MIEEARKFCAEFNVDVVDLRPSSSLDVSPSKQRSTPAVSPIQHELRYTKDGTTPKEVNSGESFPIEPGNYFYPPKINSS